MDASHDGQRERRRSGLDPHHRRIHVIDCSPDAEQKLDADLIDSGGLEILFGNEKKHKIDLPAQSEEGSPSNIAYLLQYLVKHLMKDQRKDMFIMEDNVYVELFYETYVN